MVSYLPISLSRNVRDLVYSVVVISGGKGNSHESWGGILLSSCSLSVVNSIAVSNPFL